MEEYQDQSLRGKVFHKLRENILSGVYQDHEELREAAIGEEMGVSRTPVREALRQLELEGLVTLVPNRGAYVTGISSKDVRDIYEIRSMLEGLCARWATEHITQKEIEALEEVILLSEFYLKKPGQEQARQVAELDGKFHKILYDVYRNSNITFPFFYSSLHFSKLCSTYFYILVFLSMYLYCIWCLSNSQL